MAKRRRKPRLAWKLPAKFTRPLEPEVFRHAFTCANAAVWSPPPLLHERVSPHGILRDDHTGEVQERWWLNDTPMNRVNLTLRECFVVRLEYMSAAHRFWALQDLLDDPRLDPWILVKGDEGWDLHEALIAVAATAPLVGQGEFAVAPFLAALERWAAEHPEQHAEELRKRRRP
jgi:hypothetical protein